MGGSFVQTDIIWPLAQSYLDGNKYMVTFQDDGPRYLYVGFMWTKSDLYSALRSFTLKLN